MNTISSVSALMALTMALANHETLNKQFDEIMHDARNVSTAGDMRSIVLMLDHHYLKTGCYPSEQNFENWLSENFKENGLRELRNDLWNNAFEYSTFNRHKQFRLISAGKDGVIYTDDDIVTTGP